MLLHAMRRWCWCAIHVVALSSCAHAPRESDLYPSDDDDDGDDVGSSDDPYDDDDDAPYDDDTDDPDDDAPYDDDDDTRDAGARDADARDAGARDASMRRDASTERDASTDDQPTARRDGGVVARDASAADADIAGDEADDDPLAAPSEPAARDAGARDAGLDASILSGRDAASRAGPEPVDAGTSKPADAGSPPANVPDAGGTRGSCVPGTYRGVFNGDISALLGRIHIQISGDIVIDLTGTVGGSELQVKSGRLQGTDQSGNPIEARISGRVDCRTHTLLEGQLSSGTYRRPDPIWGGAPITTGFRGVTTGTFFDDPASVLGRWEVVNDHGTRSGSGTWTARIQN